MENIIYTGFFVDQKEILEKFPVDTNKYPNVFAHHCTSTFKPTDEEIEDFERIFGHKFQQFPLKVIARLQTDKVDVLIISNKIEYVDIGDYLDNNRISYNNHAHITLATAEGVKPFESNKEILANISTLALEYIDSLDSYPGLYTSNNKAKKLGQAVIVDIDRTLCNITENGNGKKRSPYDWDRVHEDKPIEAMCQLVRSIQNNYHIVLLTGRSEDAREGTENWLRDNLIDYDKLLMKASGSYEQSAITKYESYVNDIKDEYNIAFAIDDDQRIVDMWSEKGILCLKV